MDRLRADSCVVTVSCLILLVGHKQGMSQALFTLHFRAATAVKAGKVWCLPRFWVSIRSYKKPVKKILGLNIGPCLAQIRRGGPVFDESAVVCSQELKLSKLQWDKRFKCRGYLAGAVQPKNLDPITFSLLPPMYSYCPKEDSLCLTSLV